jgi:hypothetical protein
MNSNKGNNPPSHRRLVLRPMLLLLCATNISAARKSKHITCQAFRRPIIATYFSDASSSYESSSSTIQTKSTGRGRAAFVAHDHHNQRRRHPTKCTRQEKQIHSFSQLKSTSYTSSHLEDDDTISKQRKRQFHKRNSLIKSRIKDLKSHPAVVWNESSTFASMHKKKLSRRHLHLFERNVATGAADDNSSNNSSAATYQDELFDQFATAVCHAGVVARKEVFETWASALYIHYTFLTADNNDTDDGVGSSSSNRPIKRIVDVAAGHGLLAWALLLLSDDEERSSSSNNNNKKKDTPASSTMELHEQQQQPLTVFCLDVQMPPSAELIHTSMIKQWPHLQDRFDYVEARLEQLVPHPSCLLASVHACGILSDVLVATAAQHQMPLALVPCCHSRKRKLLEDCASPFAKREYDDILNTKKSLPNLADLLDDARMTALENAGCDVTEVFIPEIFTGKNRLIMGRPTISPLVATSDASVVTSTDAENAERSPPLFRKGQMPPLLDDDKTTTTTTTTTTAINPKARFMKGFYVPCEDTTESRLFVSNIAGRSAANKRKELMHNRNHVNAPQMDLSLWLRPEDAEKGDGGVLTKESLTRILEMMSPEHVTCEVNYLGDVYINPTGRKARTFRVQYNQVDGETLSFDEAKLIHTQLRDAVPNKFPGAECR